MANFLQCPGFFCLRLYNFHHHIVHKTQVRARPRSTFLHGQRKILNYLCISDMEKQKYYYYLYVYSYIDKKSVSSHTLVLLLSVANATVFSCQIPWQTTFWKLLLPSPLRPAVVQQQASWISQISASLLEALLPSWHTAASGGGCWLVGWLDGWVEVWFL